MPAAPVDGTVNIRPRLHSDMAGCVCLLGHVHEWDGYPLRWPADPQAWLTDSRQVAAWVAERAGMIAGHVALAPATQVRQRAHGPAHSVYPPGNCSAFRCFS